MIKVRVKIGRTVFFGNRFYHEGDQFEIETLNQFSKLAMEFINETPKKSTSNEGQVREEDPAKEIEDIEEIKEQETIIVSEDTVTEEPAFIDKKSKKKTVKKKKRRVKTLLRERK